MLLVSLVSLAFFGTPAMGAKGVTLSPDVLVLVLSGTGTFDQVSINYTSDVPKEQALRDIDALARETSWIVRERKITVAAATVPGAKPTTSSVFQTPPLPDSQEGTLPLEPFISVLRRFGSIQINYLLIRPFDYRGLKEFENDYVKIDLKRGGNSYQFAVRVKDRDFGRLKLPTTSAKAEPPRRDRMPAGARMLIVFGLAIAGAAVAYLIAAYVAGRRREA